MFSKITFERRPKVVFSGKASDLDDLCCSTFLKSDPKEFCDCVCLLFMCHEVISKSKRTIESYNLTFKI